MLRGDEKGLKPNSLPRCPIDRKERGNTVPEKNLLGLIPRKSFDNLLNIQGNTLSMSENKAKSTKFLGQATLFPRNYVEAMMLKILSS